MHILLTGRPGIGKTTAIEKIAHLIGKEKVGGFISQEIRVRGRRMGFQLITLDGERGILAHVNRKTGPKVGKYRVNLKDIEDIAIKSMEKARREGKIIIIDEIATMELKSSNFLDEVLNCLNNGKVIATIQDRSSKVLDSLRERKDTKVIRLAINNRDEVPARVLSMLDFPD